MLCEISGRLTPAHELFEKAAEQSSGALKAVFASCAEQIQSGEEPDVRSIMDGALEQQAERLPHVCTLLLWELGSVLGAYDAGEQVEALERLSGRVGAALEELRQGKADRCRTYEVLGVCAGCALAILLL